MFSFWPFRRDDANSPKSFEKRLADLSDKIQRLQVRDDTLRATHRKLKVLFTLYSSFIYILVFLILVLVTGYETWTAREWTAVSASPVAIFIGRYIIDTYFDWREGNVRTRLESKIKERDVVIKKLKDAMRYDSTKELLEKYGGATPNKNRTTQPQAKVSKNSHSRQSSDNQAAQAKRTSFVPPPTANIPGRNSPAQNAPDSRPRSLHIQGSSPQSTTHSRQPSAAVSEHFAPNAFEDWQRVPSPPSQGFAAPAPPPRSGFLDRMLDLMVGEDENAPRNRIVLLCTSCRTVNGQAPPGIRTLQELGKWRCGTCGAWNGVEDEVGKLLKESKSKDTDSKRISSVSLPDPKRISSVSIAPSVQSIETNDGGPQAEGKLEKQDEDPSTDEELDLSTTPAGSTRSKARQKETS